MAVSEEAKLAMAKVGVLEPLVNLLREGTQDCAEAAAGALEALATVEANQAALAGLGAIEPLVFLAAEGSPEGKARSRNPVHTLPCEIIPHTRMPPPPPPLPSGVAGDAGAAPAPPTE